MPLAFPPRHQGKIMYYYEALRFIIIPAVVSIPLALLVYAGVQTLSEKNNTPNPSSPKTGNNLLAPILIRSSNTPSPGKDVFMNALEKPVAEIHFTENMNS